MRNSKNRRKDGLKDKLYTDEDMMEVLGVSMRTLQSMRANDEIPYIRIRRRCYYLKDSIMKWLEDKQKNNEQRS